MPKMRRSGRETEPVLRLRACGSPECGTVFTICVSCDRGQRTAVPIAVMLSVGGRGAKPTDGTRTANEVARRTAVVSNAIGIVRQRPA